MNNENQFLNVNNPQVTNNISPQTVMTSSNLVDANPKKGLNKTIILIILGVLIVTLGVITIIYFSGKKSNNEVAILESIYDSEKPIIVKKDGKYGYIDSEGNMMIEPQFVDAEEFNGDFAVVKVDNPDTTAYNEYIYQVIDKKGNAKILLNGYDKPIYYAEYDIWYIEGILYDSKLNSITSDSIFVSEYIDKGYFEYSDSQNDESGIINYKGKKVYSWAGDYIYAEISDNDYSEDDLYVRVTSYGERDSVVSLKTGELLYSVTNPEANHLYVNDNNVFKEYDSNYELVKIMIFMDGKLAYQTTEELSDLEIYDYENQIIEIDYGYNYDTKGKTQQYYYYDVKKKHMLPEKPENPVDIDLDIDLMELTYGYKEISSNGKYGLMANEKVALPCEYDDIEFINESLFNYMKESHKQELLILKKDDVTILYDLKNQKAITTFNARYVDDYSDSTFLKVTIYEDYVVKNYVIYNLLSGQSMTVNKDDNLAIKSNYITISKDNKKTYYNTKLEQIYVGEV